MMVLFYAKGFLHFLEGSSYHKKGVTKKNISGLETLTFSNRGAP